MIICRLKGGLGNQLFCYAAARRLALYNDVELVLDSVSGFIRDKKYRRSYALEPFSISARLATPSERFEPFERPRRALCKFYSKWRLFENRSYIVQENELFDDRLVTLQTKRTLYLDGLWQSVDYFSDAEEQIRKDLSIIEPNDIQNKNMARKILQTSESVALHVRWFDSPHSDRGKDNASCVYYQNAINHIQGLVPNAHFYVFSDNPTAALNNLKIEQDAYTIVNHNINSQLAYADLWLMGLCKHYITANSTFSWWGAWLGQASDSIVVTPEPSKLDLRSFWRSKGLIPESWYRL